MNLFKVGTLFMCTVFSACTSLPEARSLPLGVGLGVTNGYDAEIGSWASVNETVRIGPTGGGTFTTLGHQVWICDTRSILPPDGPIKMRRMGTRLKHQPFPGGPTGEYFGLEMQEVRVSVGSYSCGNSPEPIGVVFPSYQNTYDPHELPDRTWATEFFIDASRSTHLGIQIRAVGSCKAPAVTALPGGPAVSLPLENGGYGTCFVQLRLCSVPSSPIYRPENSCAIVPN